MEALRAAGAEVVDIGTVSTDMFYFAAGTLDVDAGFTISASHNPKEWNGFNCCRRGAVPLALGSGLEKVRDLALAGQGAAPAASPGGMIQQDVWDDFADYVLTYVDRSLLRPMKIVANGNCGLQVQVLRRVAARGKLPIEIIGIYESPDGSFPVPGGVQLGGHNSPNVVAFENRRIKHKPSYTRKPRRTAAGLRAVVLQMQR